MGSIVVSTWSCKRAVGQIQTGGSSLLRAGKEHGGSLAGTHNSFRLKWWTCQYTDYRTNSQYVRCIRIRSGHSLHFWQECQKQMLSINLTDCCCCLRVKLGRSWWNRRHFWLAWSEYSHYTGTTTIWWQSDSSMWLYQQMLKCLWHWVIPYRTSGQMFLNRFS